MMDTCLVDLEARRFVINFDWCDMYPKVKLATRDSVEQLRHKSVPMGH